MENNAEQELRLWSHMRALEGIRDQLSDYKRFSGTTILPVNKLKHYDDLVWQFNNICGGVDCVAILVDDFRATTKEARLAVEQSGDEDAKKFLNDVVCTFKKYVREIVSDAACEVGYSRRATTNLKKIAESSRKIKNARNRNILLYTIIGAIENNTDFDDTKGYTIPLYDKKEMSGVASAINMALL